MTVVSDETTRVRAERGRLAAAVRLPAIAWAVLASRLLILLSSAVGTAAFGRVPGWSMFDPSRLSSSFGSLGNALLGASVRWDSIHYVNIAEHGYKPAEATGFFPLYPLLIHVLSWVVGSDVAAGVLISVCSFAIGLLLLHRLTQQEIGPRAADATVLLLAFAPLSMFFTAIYAESLLLALSVATFYLARRGHLRLGCVAAACAALTHIEGVLLVAPLAFMFWDDRGRPADPRQLITREATALLLPFVALAGLFSYMQAIGYGWLAPITGARLNSHGFYATAPTTKPGSTIFLRSFDGPILTIWRAVESGASGIWQTLHGSGFVAPGLGDVFSVTGQNVVYLVILMITLASLVGAWLRLPTPYAIYATLVVLLYTSSVVAVIPLRSFDRYMMPAFPLWMSAAAWLESRRRVPSVLLVSSVLLIFYTVELTRWASIA